MDKDDEFYISYCENNNVSCYECPYMYECPIREECTLE
jgi:hypothetical protein